MVSAVENAKRNELREHIDAMRMKVIAIAQRHSDILNLAKLDTVEKLLAYRLAEKRVERLCRAGYRIGSDFERRIASAEEELKRMEGVDGY